MKRFRHDMWSISSQDGCCTLTGCLFLALPSQERRYGSPPCKGVSISTWAYVPWAHYIWGFSFTLVQASGLLVFHLGASITPAAPYGYILFIPYPSKHCVMLWEVLNLMVYYTRTAVSFASGFGELRSGEQVLFQPHALWDASLYTEGHLSVKVTHTELHRTLCVTHTYWYLLTLVSHTHPIGDLLI